MSIQVRETLTPREQMIYEQEKEAFKRQSEHAIAIKRLELEASKLDSKIGAWFRLPIMIIKLPVYLLVGLALVVYAIRGIEPPELLVNLFK